MFQRDGLVIIYNYREALKADPRKKRLFGGKK
jgi:hypothetical protein